MRKALLLIALLSFETASAQEMADKDFDSFYREEVLNSKGIVIVNFWATWCKPCVHELPYFERINSEMNYEMFNVLLVNLDFNSKYKISASEFIKNKNIKSKVIHLNDTDPDKWINKVDSSWSGAIPATIIFKDRKKVFFKEGEMTYEEIKSISTKLINQ